MRSIILIALLTLLAVLGHMTEDDTVFPYVKAGVFALFIRWSYVANNAVSAHLEFRARQALAHRKWQAEQERHSAALAQQFSGDRQVLQKAGQAVLASRQVGKAGG